MFGTNLTACTQVLKRIFANGLQEFADFTNNGLTFLKRAYFWQILQMGLADLRILQKFVC